MCKRENRSSSGSGKNNNNNSNNNNNNSSSSTFSSSNSSSSSSSSSSNSGGDDGGGGGTAITNTTTTTNTTVTTIPNTTTATTTTTTTIPNSPNITNTIPNTTNTSLSSPTSTVNTNTTTTTKPPLLVSFGNPLLDITAVVKNSNLHKRFGLPVDGQLEVNEHQRPVFSHVMKEFPVEYTAGGCALNSSRVFCWVLGEGQRVVFVGGIGKDEAARRLSAIVEESGVITRFVVVEGQPTGVCVALVLGACRCLCADIGAAATCLPGHVFTPQLLPMLEAAEFIYVEGYFITHSFPAALQIAEYAQRNEKTLVFNLCGSYVCENNFDELRQLLPFVDILFGFVEEYRTLDSALNVEDLSATQCHEPENICHDLLLVLRAIRGEEEVIGDCVKDKQEIEKLDGPSSSSSSSSYSSVLAFADSSTSPSSAKHNTTTTTTATASPHHHLHHHCNPIANTTTPVCDGEVLVDGIDSYPDSQSPSHSASHSPSHSASQSPKHSASHSPSHSASQSPKHSASNPDSHPASQSTSYLPNGTLEHLANGNHNAATNGTPQLAQNGDTQPVRGGNESGGGRVKQRVVVVTKGPSPLLYCQRGVVRERPVPPITPEEIVDTTGAGDSFVGGFLAALSHGRPLPTCLDCGVWTAQHLLRQKGCTLPPYPADFLVSD